jgi:lipopolysaccharide transport system ATP-binding protein
MSSDNIAISVTNISKCYNIYSSPRDRLKQFILPKFQYIAGRPVHRYYNEFWALNNINFTIKKVNQQVLLDVMAQVKVLCYS